MKKSYFFILSPSSCGGHIIATFPFSRKKDALEFVRCNSKQDLSLCTGLWNGYGEFPRANLKQIKNSH